MKIKELYELLASIKTISTKRSQDLKDWYDRFPDKDKTATLKNFFSALRVINIRITEFTGHPLEDNPKLAQLVIAMKDTLRAEKHHQALKQFIADSDIVAQQKILDSQSYFKSCLLWVADVCGEPKTLTDSLRNSAGISFQFALFNTLSILYGAHLLTPKNLHSFRKNSLFKYMPDVDRKLGKAEEIKQALIQAKQDIGAINRGLIQFYFDLVCGFCRTLNRDQSTLFPAELTFSMLNLTMEELLLHIEIDVRGVLHKAIDVALSDCAILPLSEDDLTKAHKELDDSLADKDESRELSGMAGVFFRHYPLRSRSELVGYLSQYQSSDTNINKLKH